MVVVSVRIVLVIVVDVGTVVVVVTKFASGESLVDFNNELDVVVVVFVTQSVTSSEPCGLIF